MSEFIPAAGPADTFGRAPGIGSRRPRAGRAPPAPWPRRAFVLAIGAFVLAALTGSLLRFGVQHGMPYGLQYLNVRHAHTHLMYFGWVTPALFALIGVELLRRRGRPLPRAFGVAIAATLLTGALAYPPFLLSGYQLTQVGDARLPLSMIAAGLAVLAWYGWAATYLAASWHLRRDLALFALDAAVLTLLVSSTGAWGLALAALSPVASGTLMDALVHFYLDLFSHGWFALALLGLLLAALPTPLEERRATVDGRSPRAALLVLLAGMLLSAFGALLGWPAVVVTALRLAAAAGLLALALRLTLAAARAREAALTLLAALLAAKALLDGALAFDAAAAWSQRMLLPVPLLHGYLLGFVTLTLVWLALRTWRPRATAAFWLAAAAVAVMLASLAPLTVLFPAGWRGPWVLRAAAWASLLPTAAMVVVAATLVSARQRRRREAGSIAPTWFDRTP